ncbi:MAG: histone deacetylase family protein [Rhodopirellula sp.]|nr:histone deacetylase family protein [Rhodopirellula sp.]
MFVIRRIHDDALPVNKEAILQVQEILRSRFSAVRPEDIDQLAEKLRNPFKQRFRTILFVAERQSKVLGFALLMHEPELHFCYLDFIASAKGLTGRGIGGALYERVRREAFALQSQGLFFECLPDDPKDCSDAQMVQMIKENASRIRFYERYGALPVIDNAYQTPVRPQDIYLPYLMFDGLDRGAPLRREFARKVVRTILERKYGYLCPPEYVEKVVQSFRDDPVRLREPKYTKKVVPHTPATRIRGELAGLVVNEKHDIHHIRERGYVESPVRIKSILSELEPMGLFEKVDARNYSDKHILAVHDSEFVEYLRKVCAGVNEGKSLYPYVFPIRNAARPPKDLSVRAGYYCIDTFTPLNRNAFLAAKRAVDCSLRAADLVLAGRRLAYGLIRPPGHHAERRVFGGFCYFNNCAIAANYLSAQGNVAIVDIDYHHGNGQQEIFYRRSDVLTVSLHGHPNFAYPYFSGFEDERGEAEGEGFNWNFALPEDLDGGQYREALAKALKKVVDFAPTILVIALGLDTARGDPTGTWHLGGKDFHANGRMLGELGLPTLVIQEGGYRTRTLGANARRFFEGLVAGMQP